MEQKVIYYEKDGVVRSARSHGKLEVPEGAKELSPDEYKSEISKREQFRRTAKPKKKKASTKK